MLRSDITELQLLQAKQEWCWFIDGKSRHLAIDLGQDMVFITPYHESKLRAIPDLFCLDHLACYQQVSDVLSTCLPSLSAPQLTQVTLNAVAAKFFHKSVASKSWLYEKASYALDCQNEYQLAYLTSSNERSLALTLEGDVRGKRVILITQLNLTNGKTCEAFTYLNVISDRLTEFQSNIADYSFPKTA